MCLPRVTYVFVEYVLFCSLCICFVVYVCACCICMFALLPCVSMDKYVLSTVQGHVVLESVQYRGQHVGVLPDGTVKAPGRTGKGQHAQFVLTLHKSIKVSLLSSTMHFVTNKPCMYIPHTVSVCGRQCCHIGVLCQWQVTA